MKTRTYRREIGQPPALMIADIERPADRFDIIAMVDNDFKPSRRTPVGGHEWGKNQAEEFWPVAPELPKPAVRTGAIKTTKRAEMAH
ncbi:MAG: hypothetical protein ABI898_09745 [Sphingomonadales bacterium]